MAALTQSLVQTPHCSPFGRNSVSIVCVVVGILGDWNVLTGCMGV